jgi:hypothetical protein
MIVGLVDNEYPSGPKHVRKRDYLHCSAWINTQNRTNAVWLSPDIAGRASDLQYRLQKLRYVTRL